MRKGIKILGMILSAAVLLSIFLPVALSLLLSLNSVQNFVVDKAAAFASRKLETVVKIGHVDIDFFRQLTISDFYVEDYQQDTLLYVRDLKTSVGSFGFFGDGGIVLRNTKLNDALFCLCETPEGEMNVKQIVDRMSSKKGDGGGKFRMVFRGLEARGLEFRLQRNDERKWDTGIDWADMRLCNIRAQLSEFIIDGPTLAGTINRFSTRERSGFELQDLTGKFYIVNGAIGLTDAYILTPQSTIHLPTVSIVGDSWADYKDYINLVAMDVEVQNASLTSDDIAYFAPGLKDLHLAVRAMSMTASGTVAAFEAKNLQLTAADHAHLHADLSISGLPDLQKARFDLRLRRFSATSADGWQLLPLSVQQKITPQLLTLLSRAGNMDVTGRCQGRMDNFKARALLATAVGTVDCDLKSTTVKMGQRSLVGQVAARNFQIGTLLGQKLLGHTSLVATIDGVVGGAGADARVKADVSLLEVNGESYDSLRLDGQMLNRQFNGHIESRDQKLNFDFDGLVNLNEELPYYDFAMNLRCADLHAMRFNLRDSVSLLSMQLNASVAGRSIDDMNGEIRVSNATYKYNASSIKTTNLLLVGQNTADRKKFNLTSDFADISFQSKRSYKEVFTYLHNSLREYLPLLYNDGKTSVASTNGISVVDDYALLSVQIKHLNPITDALAQGLQVADGSQLHLLFNPASRQLSLRVNSTFIERDKLLATNLSIAASNRGDSLVMRASVEDLYSGGLHLRQLSLLGGARENKFSLSVDFNDTITHSSGQIGCLGSILPGEQGRGHKIDLHLTPSKLTRGAKTWQIFARQILIDSARVDIDRFRIVDAGQELLVDGVASRSRRDSVRLTLRNFDLAPFTQVASNMGYEIDGRSNGYAVVQSALKEGVVTADIRFDSVKVNGLSVAPSRLLSRWDVEQNRAGVLVLNRENQDTLIRGFYVPSKVRYYARATMNKLQLNLLDPILSGVITNTKGAADVDVVLTGQGRQASLKGKITAQNVSTTVDFTQVTYSIPSMVIDVKNNQFTAHKVPVYDPEKHSGLLNLRLDFQHLSNIAYAVDIAPKQMLVLNTTAKDNNIFYGRVYASGMARISGDKRGVNLDIAAATDDNTTFYMPLSNKSNVAKADFVTFESANEQADTADFLVRKKMMFERSQKKKTVSGGSMNINLAINVRPNADFQLVIDPAAGDMIKGRGEGMLNLHINPKESIFEMYGDYEITEGSYLFTLQNIVNKKFIIESGSTIQWMGEPLDAILNINAIYKLKASIQPLLGAVDAGGGRNANSRPVPVDCIIHLGDRLSNPSKSFNIRLPNADSETQTAVANILNTETSVARQFLFLLMFNNFYPENSSAASANIGSVASAATGFELLTNQLSSMLSNDAYNILLRYRPKSETTSDEVDFGFSKSLLNNRLFVEVEGNYVLDNKQAVNSQMSNFMGEAYITWMIDRAGTLKLKAFTQTIDRFDETQGLQETGIGIYYKEDFNNFKDLKQRIKDRFTNKARKARRTERRAAKERERAATQHEINRPETPLHEDQDAKQ
ncbi:MAG: translocation/assembly module TamB domain-containing protein [Alistipes sp.]